MPAKEQFQCQGARENLTFTRLQLKPESLLNLPKGEVKEMLKFLNKELTTCLKSCDNKPNNSFCQLLRTKTQTMLGNIILGIGYNGEEAVNNLAKRVIISSHLMSQQKTLPLFVQGIINTSKGLPLDDPLIPSNLL